MAGMARQNEQVVMALHREGEERVAVFHCGDTPPKMKIKATYDTIPLEKYLHIQQAAEQHANDSDDAPTLKETPLHIPGTDRRSILTGRSFEDGRVVVRRPTHAVVEGHVAVPGRQFLPEHLEEVLGQLLRDSEFSEETDEVRIQLDDVNDRFLGNEYVFLVKYRFEQPARQPRLF